MLMKNDLSYSLQQEGQVKSETTIQKNPTPNTCSTLII